MTRPRDWKANAVLGGPDVAAASKRLPPWQPSVPKIEHLPAPPEPPPITITAEAILKLLQAARQRESQPETAAQQASDTSTDGQTQKTRQKPLNEIC